MHPLHSIAGGANRLGSWYNLFGPSRFHRPHPHLLKTKNSWESPPRRGSKNCTTLSRTKFAISLGELV